MFTSLNFFQRSSHFSPLYIFRGLAVEVGHGQALVRHRPSARREAQLNTALILQTEKEVH